MKDKFTHNRGNGAGTREGILPNSSIFDHVSGPEHFTASIEKMMERLRNEGNRAIFSREHVNYRIDIRYSYDEGDYRIDVYSFISK